MYRFVKRFFDIILCSLALVVLSPVFLLTALGIELSSPGTVLYHSMRAGLHKKPFKFYKFRSMHPPKGKKQDMFIADPNRVFRFGKLIRRLKIDELPQLFNVVKGDMSIVGPRPMTVEHVDELYCGEYEIVTTAKPGLTSAASLYDYTVGDTYSDNVAYSKEVLPIKLKLERYYVEHESFLYDAQLVWRTIVTIVQVLLKKKNLPPQPELAAVMREEA
ncbi:MAG: sugar transferase [Oscillospiraceae bacterium]|nr:sugar transferase [Oscillospiraceae bacterium]